MNTEEQARELMAERRHHNEHVQESMRTRAEAEVNQSSASDMGEQARELLTEQRHHNEHVQESMRTRAEAELSGGHETADSAQ